MRSLILFVIGLVFGTGLGFVLGSPIKGHDHAGHGDAAHDHSQLVQWGDAPLPTIALVATSDTKSGVNLQISTTNFTMTPEAVGGPDAVGSGHAHVYLNGDKIGRVYSDWVHVPDAETGDVIRVTLNGNSHAGWAGPDGPIVAEVIVQ